MSLLSFKTTFDTFSFYLSWRLSHGPALKPINTNPKCKFNAHKLGITSFQSAACHKCKN